MVQNFNARKREAEKLRVCATCAIRDPSMPYSDLINLAELPPDHWCRIAAAAYERLIKGMSIPWIKRGDDGTYNERTASGLDNHSRMQIPWHEFFTKFEWEGQAFHVAPEAIEWLPRPLR